MTRPHYLRQYTTNNTALGRAHSERELIGDRNDWWEAYKRPSKWRDVLRWIASAALIVGTVFLVKWWSGG